MGGIRAAKLDIVFNRILKEINILKDHRNIFHQAVQFEIPYILAYILHKILTTNYVFDTKTG